MLGWYECFSSVVVHLCYVLWRHGLSSALGMMHAVVFCTGVVRLWSVLRRYSCNSVPGAFDYVLSCDEIWWRLYFNHPLVFKITCVIDFFLIFNVCVIDFVLICNVCVTDVIACLFFSIQWFLVSSAGFPPSPSFFLKTYPIILHWPLLLVVTFSGLTVCVFRAYHVSVLCSDGRRLLRRHRLVIWRHDVRVISGHARAVLSCNYHFWSFYSPVFVVVVLQGTFVVCFFWFLFSMATFAGHELYDLLMTLFLWTFCLLGGSRRRCLCVLCVRLCMDQSIST